MKKVVLIGLILGLTGLVLVAGNGATLTGNQILQQVDDQETRISQGSLVSKIRFDNSYSDGTTAYNIFGGISTETPNGPKKSLIYFEAPEDVVGTIFLSIKPSPDEDARMWLYLPALGMAKEIVAEQRKQSFAGSTFSYKDIGSRSFADKYSAKLVGEEAVKIGDKSYDCYVLALTAKPDSDADYPTGKAWIDKSSFLMLKSEDYNSDGKLARTMEVLALGTFEGNMVADKMIARNVIDGSSTTITFLERKRPASEIPDSVFDPNNLASFDPSAYGL
jgi:hypothetical protein